MARPFPYTFISCPCAETPSTPALPTNRLSRDLSNITLSGQRLDPDTDDEDRTFDPRSSRANYSLYPPEHLLYCEDCHQIKCPRCITEEIVCWYCPNCLFETPSSMVRSEGNRCARNCFNCPICTSPLSVTTLGSADNGAQNGPWILSCGYCMWTTLDIGIKFDKPTNIRAQLTSLSNGQNRSSPEIKSPLANLTSPDDGTGLDSQDERLAGTAFSEEKPATIDPESRFSALKSFYRNQLTETSTSPTDPLVGPELGSFYSSPSALNRIMSLYTAGIGNLHGAGSKKPKSKPPVMREALTPAEGLHIPDPNTEQAIIQKMASPDCGWDGLASVEQKVSQPPSTRFVDELRPLPVLLRTKRSKRCKACKHILVKPEFKPQSTRFRIRLIALSYIPLTIMRPLPPFPASSPPVNLDALEPGRPVQFLITLKNHMFDPIRITLATPSVTPGRVESKVTMLCPQFEVGANSDVWDEALASSAAQDPRSSRSGLDKVAEAGKIWDKGRNWTTVAMEVVPGSLPDLAPGEEDEDEESDVTGMEEDEDVIEIPVFVRVEWEAEGGAEDLGMRPDTRRQQEAEMVKRELAYWMVLGIGRIKRAGHGHRH
ncbi:dynactin 4 [Blastomyces dermatitidis ATCC 18188]|uniref:Dynactin subunit 4 n=1 Tax=Ajellomyces dermatitidis (strain ATCC 18188 / CBS 674.68) TaxID=653446 RepID=F2TPB1_AJEDA|nr:dynactin 4 [Blastomyces dermatitidis ATCC 18188]